MSDRHDEIFDDFCVTMQKYATTKITELVTDAPTLTYFDWDTVSEENELPDTDLFGPSGMGMTDEGKLIDLVFAFGMSTVNDKNLFRLRKMASKVYKDFRPDALVPIYNHSTGEIYSWAKVTGPTAITPINRSVTRPLMFVTVRALLNPFSPYTS